MVAAEAAPFAKVGGLGDVTGTLPRRLVELGLEVAAVLPLYREVRLRGYDPRPTGREVVLDHGGTRRSSPVLEQIADGVRYWFIREDTLYDREGVYGPPGGEYPDSPLRYSYLSRAALHAARIMGFAPDIIHCHDWHSALTFLYGDGEANRRNGERAGTVLTIHNLAYQGVFDQAAFPSLGLPDSDAARQVLEHNGSLNFLKAGIESADLLTTVSPTYAQEIMGSDHGCGLENLLARRSQSLTGILNGIDYDTWNPAADPCLEAPYSQADVSGRAVNRTALLRELGINAGPGAPTISFIGRLVHQKGADVLAQAVPAMMEEGFCVIVLGSGDPLLEEKIRETASQFPGRVSVRLGFDEGLARRIYAGTDFFLMPSRFEPCGLGQMIAMRYGAVPVVRSTGGLKDTVLDLRQGLEGNGILFDQPGHEDLVAAVQRAGEVYRSGELAKVVPRVMALDHSWRRSAMEYSGLYRALVAKGKG